MVDTSQTSKLINTTRLVVNFVEGLGNVGARGENLYLPIFC